MARGKNGRFLHGKLVQLVSLDSVDFPRVVPQIVEHLVSVGRPQLGRLVVRARGQQPPTGVPLDRIDLVRVALCCGAVKGVLSAFHARCSHEHVPV